MRFKKHIQLFLWICAGVTLVFLFLFICLPSIVESQIEKRLSKMLSPNAVAFDIQKIGVSNAFVSSIRISEGVSIDSINIEYTRKNWSSFHLTCVTLSGLKIHAGLDRDNQIKIQGLSIPETKKDQTARPHLPFLSFLPEKIVLENAKLILHSEKDEFLIPFDVLSSLSAAEKKITARTVIYPFGEKVNTLITYDINTGLEHVKIESNSFDLGHLDQFFSRKTKGIQLTGGVDFNLESFSPKKKWELNISQVNFAQPIKAQVKDILALLNIDNQKITAVGTFGLSHPMIPLTVMEYDLTLDLKNRAKNDFQFDVRLKNSPPPNYPVKYESMAATINNPQLNVTVKGSLQKSKGEIRFGFNQGQLQQGKNNFLFADTNIQSMIAADFTDQGTGITSTFFMNTENIRFKSDQIDSTFPLAEVSGDVLFDKKKTPVITMTLKAFDGQITASDVKTRASGITVELPFSYPDIKPNIYGKYSIPKISYDNRYYFTTNGRMQQTGSNKIQVTGGVTFTSLPGLTPQFTADLGFEKGVRASLAITIKDGTVFLPDSNLTATGINTLIRFNDLPALESVPGQVLSIDSIHTDKIKIDTAKVQFSIEDGNSLLVENIQFKWCNGRVSTEAIRFPQKNNAYSLSLYCDRLELTQLLEQVGAFTAEGTGTLNGRIPVMYSKGNIAFDNGFLFSTPGSGGKLVIQNTGRITAGIPMDSPQFSQLDLAQEALKDFEYQWAKLRFNTFENTLYVNMELDGKPSKLMPFEYKKDLGGFVRVAAKSPGSHFQGIKLDVNLALPFNDVIKFGNKLNSILK